jgi:hypothetical protein
MKMTTRGNDVPDANDETSDLIATVEEIRERSFAQLDPELVAEILTVHHRYANDRAEARKLTEQAINRWIATHAPQGEGV